MRIDQLSSALAMLEGGELSPYWLLQPVAQATQGTTPFPIAKRSLQSTAVHPLGVWLLHCGVLRSTLQSWQADNLIFFSGGWYARLAAQFSGELEDTLGLDPLSVSVLCAIVETAPFLHFKGRHWGRGVVTVDQAAPPPVPSDVSLFWDAAIRAELAAHFRRVVALTAYLGNAHG